MPETNDNDSWYCLERGALGIGEDHTRPEGRRMVLDLIDSGLVTNLFVELCHTHYGTQLANAQAELNGGGNEGAVRAALPDGNLFANAQPLSLLMARALVNGAGVHMADHYIMAAGRGSRAFPKRHGEIADNFAQVTGQGPPPDAIHPNAVGSLLLWGGAHFDSPNHSLDRYIRNLPYIMCG